MWSISLLDSRNAHRGSVWGVPLSILIQPAPTIFALTTYARCRGTCLWRHPGMHLHSCSFQYPVSCTALGKFAVPLLARPHTYRGRHGGTARTSTMMAMATSKNTHRRLTENIRKNKSAAAKLHVPGWGGGGWVSPGWGLPRAREHMARGSAGGAYAYTSTRTPRQAGSMHCGKISTSCTTDSSCVCDV